MNTWFSQITLIYLVTVVYVIKDLMEMFKNKNMIFVQIVEITDAGVDNIRRKSSTKGARDIIEDKKQDPASKLEQGYIQMFLGKLEPMQESR